MNLLLLSASLFLRCASQFKNFLYNRRIIKPRKAPLLVISIGNISFGGTEKTPLATEVLSWLLHQGWKPALVSRGYKGNWENQGGILSNGNAIFGTWQDSGDEPYMVARNIPRAGVFIGKNRLSSCQNAKELGFTIAVLDDSFQHRRLKRDVDIVLVNPEEKIALREFTSSVRRADIVLIKRTSTPRKLEKQLRDLPHVFPYAVEARKFLKMGSEDILPADGFRGKRIFAFCGIARPARFATLLRETGAEVASFLAFPDHHFYPPSSLRTVYNEYYKINASAAITTEKDAVKLLAVKDLLSDIPVYYLKIGLEIDPKFFEAVQALLRKALPL